MKLYVRIILSVLCAALVLAAPFVVSSPKLLEDAQWYLIEKMDDQEGEEAGWLPMWIASAKAEEEKNYTLPVDFSAGCKPNPAGFTEDGYEDVSIQVTLETVKEDGVTWRIARVTIASPTQLRTAIAGKTVKQDSKTALVTVLARNKHAVVAMNGDYYTRDKAKHSFEYRMGEKRQDKTNKLRDILIIDENGDFHTFVKSAGADKFVKETGHQIVNAFMFGPALVQEGQVLKTPKDYAYNPNGKEPRAAIGQVGPLSYVMVIAEARGKSDSAGVTQQGLADFMGKLGCQEAYNLDGGNSATMAYCDVKGQYQIYNYKDEERDVSDIIYFASAVPEKEWE